MLRLDQDSGPTEINRLHLLGTPFFCLIDFAARSYLLFSPAEFEHLIFFDFTGKPRPMQPTLQEPLIELDKDKCLSFEAYRTIFDQIQAQQLAGNSYLTNLCFNLPCKLNYSLAQLYQSATAAYKIYYPDRFLCYSPETFIKIAGQRISTSPMKGTFKSEAAARKGSAKENAEHATIVDLLRNDLSLVARNVRLIAYQTISRIRATKKREIYQHSSTVEGELPDNYKLGTLLETLLPAGSISGAPKQKTVEIINGNEADSRNFYTGIAGHFDGRDFQSCVLIRMIEQSGDRAYSYRSGCGITADSRAKDEYAELLDKVYVPVL